MVYLGEGGPGGWMGGGEVVLPSPGSEPPPPYSPPRVPPHQHFFPSSFPSLGPHSHAHFYPPFADYFDLTPTPSQPGSLSSQGSAPPLKDPPPPYPPLASLKAAHAALNHGPSSAFAPPTKSLKCVLPPPYSLSECHAARGKAPLGHHGGRESLSHATEPRHRQRRPRQSHHGGDKTRSLDHRGQPRSSSDSRRDDAYRTQVHPSTEGRVPPLVPPNGSGHPRGPLLRTGKSLELPHDRTSHPPPATAHTHPTHSNYSGHARRPQLTTKDTSGLAPRTKEPPKGAAPASAPNTAASNSRAASKSSRHAHLAGVGPAKPARSQHLALSVPDPPHGAAARPASRSEERWAARTSRLEAAAAQAMTAARAVPVTAVSNHAQGGGHGHPAQGHEADGHMSRGRLRSCRSLDELSDLLDEEASLPRLPVATRSLDDLTEPLYENVDIIHAHARAHRPRHAHNTSVPDLLDAPPRPPRHRNNSLSSLLDDLGSCASAALTRRALNTSVPDVLEAGFSWGSPTSTLRSAVSAASARHDTASDISVQLQKIREVARVLDVKYRRGELSSSSASNSSSGPPSTHTSPRMPPSAAHASPTHHAPGVPARAPVIHDVLRDSQKMTTTTMTTTTKKTTATSGGSSLSPLEADATSQESGYSSVDSRSFRHNQRSPPEIASHAGPQQNHHRPQQQQQQKHPAPQNGYQQEKRKHTKSTHLNYHDVNEMNRQRQQQRRDSAPCRQLDQEQQQLSPRHQQRLYQAPSEGPHHQQPHSKQHPQYQYQQSAQHKQQQPYPHRQQQPDEESHSLPYLQHNGQQGHQQKGVNQDKLGIYIKSVVPGGAADQDGRLQAGDQLLSVDGKSLIGISQERAAEYMMETGPVVTLQVARQGAIYHGLAAVLSQPSPQVNRASQRKARPRAEEVGRAAAAAAAAALTNSQSTPNMGGYNERLVDWNQPPRHHPLPPTSSHSSLMARSSPNLAAATEGYPGGRHLSERDLPSKVLREHNQDPPAPPLLHQAPRIQASKSVPSLNSEAGSSVGGKQASLEVFNPSYSRTSSNTSLSQPPNPHFSHHPHQHPQQQQQQQQNQQPPIRSRSTQNLSDGSYPGLVGRHPSNPSLVVEEERYYQNVNFHQGPQDPRMGSTRTRPSQPLPMGSPASQGPPEQMRPDHVRHEPRNERPASAFMQRDDMVPHRTDIARPASQRDIRADAKMMEMTEEVRRREERMRLNGHPPASQRPGPQQAHRVPNAFSPGAPFSPEGFNGPQGFPGQHSGYHPATSQPLSPQGIGGLQQQQQQQQQQSQHAHPQYAGHAQGFPGNKLPPPTAPKPKSQVPQGSLSPDAPEKPMRQMGYDGIVGDGPPRPPPPEDGYRDSPPPPPPPTSTHPLLQSSRPSSSVGYNINAGQGNKPVFNKTSPWDREEKERNDRRRREAVRHWRDEQISSLENIENRTAQQEERLRTLRLEKEFQRRAEEMNNDDDDDEDEDEDEDVGEREDHRENEDDLKYKQENSVSRDYSKAPGNAPFIMGNQEPRMNGGGPVDEERARKVDEIRRKQQEFEAASEVEERLLREAQRRQQEEQMRRFQDQQQQHSHYQHQHHATQRLDTLVGSPFQSQYSNGPVNGSRTALGSYNDHNQSNDSTHRMETLVPGAQHSPVPPERGSSYNVMQHSQPPSNNNRHKGPDGPPTTIKRVQFSETPTMDTHITYDNNANQEKTPRQDPDNFINEAETLLNSSPNRTGGTPGVIGAQEVYRDPRWRRLQEKQAQQAAAKTPGPEKLSFKEKMKMFAMETGEAETPKDKVKISRAQRDIEH